MARAGTSLQMKFGTTHGDKTWTFNYAKADTSVATIKNLGQVMIANGEIFYNRPLSLESAELVTTSVTQVDVS